MAGKPIYFKKFIGTSIHHVEMSGKKWWQKQLMRDPCVYCGNRSTTKEHVIPRSLKVNQTNIDGYLCNIFTNVVGACESCNSERGNKPFLIWLGLKTGYLRRINE